MKENHVALGEEGIRNKECSCNCGCSHSVHREESNGGVRVFLSPALSLLMLIFGLVMSHVGFGPFADSDLLNFIWYALAFLPIGFPVIKEAWEGICNGDIFNEFTLMSVACIGAFCIGEYPEGVGVMLFYSVGETLQDKAVDKARRHISHLLDVRSERAHVLREGIVEDIDPKSVKVGEIIEVRPGERVPLDGIMKDESSDFDTSALTGESLPRQIGRGEEVLAGMVCTSSAFRMSVTHEYGRTTLSRILEMVEDAAGRKAQTEQFIRKFARIYTPLVMAMALLIVVVPWILGLVGSFQFVLSEWFYRALVFLVISCPCALVISVPLAYFAGIGAASKAGILFKGGNYLEAIRKVNAVAFDKTGTLTTGMFTVEKVKVMEGYEESEVLSLMAAAEKKSSHPLAKALVEYVEGQDISADIPETMCEFPGKGAVAQVGCHRVAAGNMRLMKAEGATYPDPFEDKTGTVIMCAIDGKYAGKVVLRDTVKPDAEEAVKRLQSLGITDIAMLSGDKNDIVAAYAEKIGIVKAIGEMLPQDKAQYIERESSHPGKCVAFVGDGMNDAPVLALSSVGIAMGALGSEAAVESADVVIQTDSPSKVVTAIRIGRATHTIVMQNIVGAIGIKVAVLILGAFGIASLWAAVFADVGVALLAVLNSVRIIAFSRSR